MDQNLYSLEKINRMYQSILQWEEGSIVMHNSIINANSSIGDNCIINTSALIEMIAKY